MTQTARRTTELSRELGAYLHTVVAPLDDDLRDQVLAQAGLLRTQAAEDQAAFFTIAIAALEEQGRRRTP